MEIFLFTILSVFYLCLYFLLFSYNLKKIRIKKERADKTKDEIHINFLRTHGYFAEAREILEDKSKKTPIVESKTFIKKRKKQDENSEFQIFPK